MILVSTPVSGSMVVLMPLMRILQVFWIPCLAFCIFKWWMKHSSLDESLISDSLMGLSLRMANSDPRTDGPEGWLIPDTSKVKFLVASKTAKGGHYCCTLNKAHVTCVCVLFFVKSSILPVTMIYYEAVAN